MQSTDLLPALRELPGGDPIQARSFRELMSDLTNAIPDPLGMEAVDSSEPLFVKPYESIKSTLDGLTVLSDSVGIPLPNTALGIKAYTDDIIASLPIIFHALENGNRFNTEDCTWLNKGRVLRTLTLMSQMGINTVLQSVSNANTRAFKKMASATSKAAGRTAARMAGEATKKGVKQGAGKIIGKVIGGGVGSAAGSIVTGVGNAAGMVAGAAVGAAAGTVVDYLVERVFGKGDDTKGLTEFFNQHLQPHMLDLALNITGLTHDDLFYYKNKPRIDEVAVSFQTTARELAATPGF